MKSLSPYLYPVMVIMIGAYAIVAQEAPGNLQLEGRYVVLIGVCWCLLGVLGLVRVRQEVRRKKAPIQSPVPTRGNGT
jgi:hypothetical protein